jgi:hypothetical protein
MNLFDPFILFCAVEVIAVVGLLVVWLDVGMSCCHVAMCSHVTPELVYLFFPEHEDSQSAHEAAVAEATDESAAETAKQEPVQRVLID